MQAKTSYQRGGTMLGFIIGGVVGLLAALIVAVFVTKVPIPFVNKAVNRNAEQDQAEALKNKNWDPNAPLAGKSGTPKVSEASAAASTAAAGGIAVASAPAAKASEPAKKASESASKPAADPLGDLVKKKLGQAPEASAAPGAVLAPKPPAPTAAASAADSAANAFFVQAGAYSNAEDAEAQRGKIALSGMEARVTEREVSGRTVYRVRVGPIEKKPDADKVRERLEGLGFDARVMTVSR